MILELKLCGMFLVCLFVYEYVPTEYRMLFDLYVIGILCIFVRIYLLGRAKCKTALLYASVN